MNRRTVATALLALGVLLGGCADNTPRCIPQTYGERCTCAGGQPGRYICAEDGTSQRECRCGDDVPLDAGPASAPDSGPDDAGAPPVDSGVGPETDAGLTADAGVVAADAGPPDSGAVTPDSGLPDGGTATDAG